MSDKLFAVVNFSGVAIGATQTLDHGLQVNGDPLKPDIVLLQFENSFELVSATTTAITVRNTANAGGACEALCNAIHPVSRSFGLIPNDGTFSQHLTPQPFCPGSPNGGGGSGAAGGVVVFRPGGVATQNVVTTWADALAILAQSQGQRVLQFDDSVTSPVPIPAGGPYDMTGVTWDTVPDRICEVRVPEGVTFTKLRSFSGRLHVTFTGTTPPVADFSSAPPQIDTVTMEDGAQFNISGAGPFFDVADTAVFELGRECALITGAHAIINVSAAAVVSVFAVGPLLLLEASTISGVVGATLNLVTANDAAIVVSETQPGFLGTKTPSNRTGDYTFPTAVLTTAALLAEASQLVLCNAAGGAFAITLPPAAGLRGQSITFKNTGTSTNNVTVTAGAGDNIDGAATKVLALAHFFCRLTSDGVHAWYVTANG